MAVWLKISDSHSAVGGLVFKGKVLGPLPPGAGGHPRLRLAFSGPVGQLLHFLPFCIPSPTNILLFLPYLFAVTFHNLVIIPIPLNFDTRCFVHVAAICFPGLLCVRPNPHLVSAVGSWCCVIP